MCATVAVLLTVIVLVSACGSQRHASPPQTASSAMSSTKTPSALQDVQAGYERVVRDVSPSVLQIKTSEGLGSGIVFDNRGDIVTNAHVVGDASSFTITVASGKQATGTLVGRWAPGDLAVIHTDAKGLKPAAFANSSALHVGDIAIALGNPLGLRSSVTQGIVSSLGRTVSEGNGVTLPSAIQTSAAINPGNSGGALVDIDGKVIGVPTLAAIDQQLGGSAAPGIGFAIPSNTVRSIAAQLVASGTVTQSGRAALGLHLATTATTAGVVVAAVTPGGGAAAAGVERGDVIVSFAGTMTPDLATLTTLVAKQRPGAHVRVVLRTPAGQQTTVTITLGQLASS